MLGHCQMVKLRRWPEKPINYVYNYGSPFSTFYAICQCRFVQINSGGALGTIHKTKIHILTAVVDQIDTSNMGDILSTAAIIEQNGQRTPVRFVQRDGKCHLVRSPLWERIVYWLHQYANSLFLRHYMWWHPELVCFSCEEAIMDESFAPNCYNCARESWRD